MNSKKDPLIIAHRGASGYLPEHTLAAKALAYAMGANYLEQDVVATRDDELLVLHDVHLDRVTDVASVFPGRARQDGRYYVRDFDLEELRTLAVWERMNEDGSAVYPGRFPAKSGTFRIHTLREELELVRGLNASTGRRAGIYPEIKRPKWHRDEGVDIAPRMLADLADFGYQSREDAVYLQCFDPDELVRIRDEFDSDLKLVQLIGDNSWGEADTDFDAMRTKAGLASLAATVDGVGPWLEHLYGIEDGKVVGNDLLSWAHAAGLEVHPYTLRLDALPVGFDSFDALLLFVVEELGADGLFTDFPDTVRRILNGRAS